MAAGWLDRITPIDPASPVPLYFQVESDLRRLIREEAFHTGTTLPPEYDLCATYGVSRHTMRTALGRLAADRLIARSPGRGTVVCAEETRTRFSLDRSFTRQMRELGRAARSVVLKRREGIVGPKRPDPLHQVIGEPYLELRRLRLGDGEPIGIQETTVLTGRCPGLDAFDFAEASLYETLAVHYRLDIQKIQHSISAAGADDRQSELLNVSAGAPLLVVRTSAFLGDDSLIEHTISHYRSDRYEYTITHTPG
jgi:GntR family transcriptional regulator